MQKFHSKFTSFGLRNHHLVKFQQSNLEGHVEALFLADHLPITDLATAIQGEIAHIHSGNDHSLHVVMAPADCKLQSYDYNKKKMLETEHSCFTFLIC